MAQNWLFDELITNGHLPPSDPPNLEQFDSPKQLYPALQKEFKEVNLIQIEKKVRFSKKDAVAPDVLNFLEKRCKEVDTIIGHRQTKR